MVGSLAAVLAVGVAVVGFVIFTGSEDSVPFLGGTREEPAECPLTGLEPEQPELAGRTAVAVKVENISAARPQAGLNEADVVFEEPVEGGITRFIAIYQCEQSPRIGPVRSARFVDPAILVQYGNPIFGYSGAAQQVKDRIADSGSLQDASQDEAPDAYELDPNLSAPHNVFTSLRALLDVGADRNAVPEPVFTYEEEPPSNQESKRGRELHLPFSPDADVFWRFARQQGVYLRAHGETDHTTEDGQQIVAENVVVQVVELQESGIVDAAGNPSPEVMATGSGNAFVFRDGRLIEGTWERPDVGEKTRFLDRNGEEIALAPGRTWVELFPRELEAEIETG